MPHWRFSKVAPYIFGVYLLNDNQYAREFLWQKIIHCSDFYNSKFMIIHLVISCALFMICAIMIEFVRINIVSSFKKRIEV